jgi:hypothetical protein
MAKGRNDMAKGRKLGATLQLIAKASVQTKDVIGDDVDGVHATIAANIRGALSTSPSM